MMIEAHDHPDFVGGIVWSDCELRWINGRIAELEAQLAAVTAERDENQKRYIRQLVETKLAQAKLLEQITELQALLAKKDEALTKISFHLVDGTYYRANVIAQQALAITSQSDALREHVQAKKVELLRSLAEGWENEAQQ